MRARRQPLPPPGRPFRRRRRPRPRRRPPRRRRADPRPRLGRRVVGACARPRRAPPVARRGRRRPSPRRGQVDDDGVGPVRRARPGPAGRGDRRDGPRLRPGVQPGRRISSRTCAATSPWRSRRGKPAILHCRSAAGRRDAQDALLEELRAAGFGGAGGRGAFGDRPPAIIHSFSGPVDYAEAMLDLGCAIQLQRPRLPSGRGGERDGRSARARRAPARRDRFAVPVPAGRAAPAQRAGVGGGDGALGRRATRHDAWKRSARTWWRPTTPRCNATGERHVPDGVDPSRGTPVRSINPPRISASRASRAIVTAVLVPAALAGCSVFATPDLGTRGPTGPVATGSPVSAARPCVPTASPLSSMSAVPSSTVSPSTASACPTSIAAGIAPSDRLIGVDGRAGYRPGQDRLHIRSSRAGSRPAPTRRLSSVPRARPSRSAGPACPSRSPATGSSLVTFRGMAIADDAGQPELHRPGRHPPQRSRRPRAAADRRLRGCRDLDRRRRRPGLRRGDQPDRPDPPRPLRQPTVAPPPVPILGPRVAPRSRHATGGYAADAPVGIATAQRGSIHLWTSTTSVPSSSRFGAARTHQSLHGWVVQFCFRGVRGVACAWGACYPHGSSAGSRREDSLSTIRASGASTRRPDDGYHAPGA